MNCAALDVEIALRWTSKYRCAGCAPAQRKCAALETALANTARYIEAGYNEATAYIEMGLSPQSTKCIHFHSFITKTRLYRGNIQVPWTSI